MVPTMICIKEIIRFNNNHAYGTAVGPTAALDSPLGVERTLEIMGPLESAVRRCDQSCLPGPVLFSGDMSAAGW